MKTVMNESEIKIKWPEAEVKALADFCSKHGIVVEHGHMSPSATLAYLKRKMGIEDAPLEERTPYSTRNLKSILHG
jgi:hypothetical protein